MTLLSQTIGAMVWVGKVNLAFLLTQRWITIGLVGCLVIERFASLLAMFLPLKVILLAGSDGVPRYFRFFIEHDDKFAWTIGLAAGAVGFYGLSLIMERFSRQLAETGAAKVLKDANEMAVGSRHQDEAQGYYSRFAGVVADGIIVATVLAVLSVLDSLLTAVVIGLVAIEYAIAAVAVRRGDPAYPRGMYSVLVSNLSSFFTVCSSVNFLVAFFVILIPFLVGVEGNILVAILSILLLRQSLNALTGGIGTTVNLWKKRAEIDPLIFRSRKQKRQERDVNKTVREVFEKKARERAVARELEKQGVETGGLVSEWQDSTLGKVFTFHVTTREENKERHFQQQVFPRGVAQWLDHESFLFKHISRAELKAPERYAVFREGPFECQVCDYGGGRLPENAEWQEVGLELLVNCWSVQPPRALMAAYYTSRPTLDERVTREVLERLTVALDHRHERLAYEKLLAQMEYLVERIKAVPLSVLNPQLGRPNTVEVGDGDYRVMSWGRWGLEPIGTDMPSWVPSNRLEQALERVRRARGLRADRLTAPEVLLVREWRRLEQEIDKENYKEALAIVGRITSERLAALRVA